MEIWKPVKELEEYYEVSNLGRVKQLPRCTQQSKTGRKYNVEEKIIKPFIWQSKYLRVDLQVCRNKIRKRRATYIHTLVAEAFIGERPKGYVIDHIDTDIYNNRADNLRYVTIKENLNNPLTQLKRKNYKMPIEIRNSISNTLSGRVWVTNDITDTLIDKIKIDEYQSMGYRLGRKPFKCKNIRNNK